MNKVRQKLLDFKQRLSDRKMYSIVIVTLAAVLGWGIYEYKEKLDYKQYLYNQFQRSFYDTASYVKNVDFLLSKALVSEDPSHNAQVLMEIWRQAWVAQTSLGQLPYSHRRIDNVMKYLTQTGDFAYTLSAQAINQKPLTKEQRGQIQKLREKAMELNDDLNKISEQFADGRRVPWDQIRKEGERELEKTAQKIQTGSFENIQKAFADLPTLIYDGPFSDHINSMQAKALENEQEITREEAQEAAKRFLGGQVKDIRYVGQEITQEDKQLAQKQTPETDVPIKTYSFEATLREENDVRIDISKKGGKVVWMLNTAPVTGKAKLNMSQAIAKAKEFLDRNGYKNMKESYYQKPDGVAVINFAYSQDDVIIYPDLIKMKINLTDGTIVGFEAYGYLMSHIGQRKLPAIKISEQEARKRANGDLVVESVQKAVIPMVSKKEVFCWEIKGRRDREEFLIYVNVETGHIEKILQLLTSDTGTLTL